VAGGPLLRERNIFRHRQSRSRRRPLGKTRRPAIARLREHGLHVDVIASTGPVTPPSSPRAYAQNYRHFIAVGGDGTATKSSTASSPRWSQCPNLSRLSSRRDRQFLPTRFHGARQREIALQALIQNRKRSVDLLRLTIRRAKPLHLIY